MSNIYGVQEIIIMMAFEQVSESRDPTDNIQNIQIKIMIFISILMSCIKIIILYVE